MGLGNVNASCKRVPHLPSRQPFKKTKRETIASSSLPWARQLQSLDTRTCQRIPTAEAIVRILLCQKSHREPESKQVTPKGPVSSCPLTPRLTGGHEPGNYHLASTKAFSPKGRGLPSPMPSGSGSPPFSAPASMPPHPCCLPCPSAARAPGTTLNVRICLRVYFSTLGQQFSRTELPKNLCVSVPNPALGLNGRQERRRKQVVLCFGE